MAKTLSEMELTDHNKESLFDGGVLAPLLHLFLHNDLQVKTVATKALRNLSTLKRNGLEMIRQGAVRPFLDLLFQHNIQRSSLWEDVAAIIMQLASSTISQDAGTPILLLESDDDVFGLFPLVSVTQPGVQQNIIQTFCILCQSSSSSYIKTKLNEV